MTGESVVGVCQMETGCEVSVYMDLIKLVSHERGDGRGTTPVRS